MKCNTHTLTYCMPTIQYNNKKLNRGQLLWPAACMFINKVSNGASQWISDEYLKYGMQ